MSRRVAKIDDSLVSGVLAALPALPESVSYVDEYDDTVRTIRDLASADLWQLSFDTHRHSLRFDTVEDRAVRHALKLFVVWALADLSPATVRTFSMGAWHLMRRVGEQAILRLAEQEPVGLRAAWEVFAADATETEASFAKAFLYFLCAMRVGAWDARFEPLIQALPFTWRKAYASVRSGEAILSLAEEGRIVAFLDDTAEAVRRGDRVLEETILRHCMLALCYVEGLRPVQLGRIALADLVIVEEVTNRTVAHISVHRAKKRDGRQRKQSIRSIRAEWVEPFVAWRAHRVRQLADARRMADPSAGADNLVLTPSDKLFPQKLGALSIKVGDAAEAILGHRRTATEFRHSAAQRLADGGASVETVAHFLGHSILETSLVYFGQSIKQAAQVNKALALSPVYQGIETIIATRTIDRKSLVKVEPDRQIGAAPHGIPIAGIGACDLGQSLCQLNPVLSCYTCRKFVPVTDVDLHRDVLASFRQVARFFFDESRDDRQSPAFMQLRTTLDAIQQLVRALDPSHQETNDVR